MTKNRMFQCCITVVILCVSHTGCDVPPTTEGARSGMVVSASQMASDVGVEILKEGGNAVDAAIAVGFALAVVYPEAGNIGGGGFMLIRSPDGSSHVVDFREVAPHASQPDMFLDKPGESVDGLKASGVPGTVAGLLAAREKYGRMELHDLIQPSIDLALKGVPVDSHLASNLQGYRESLARHPSTEKIYFRDGHVLREGDTLILDDLARTLQTIRDKGRDGFYLGHTASLISLQMAKGGGIIDSADLATYTPIIRPSLSGLYRGYEILSAGLPSSGGMCLLKTMQLLEPYNLHDSGYHSASSIHLVTEAMKRSFSLRAEYLGDPGFVDVPVESLMGTFTDSTKHFAINARAAVPAESLRGYPGLLREKVHTTHYSVIDSDGMAVAVSFTLNDLFGSKIIVEGAGFFLNDEMDDFVTVPGAPNIYGLVGGVENMIQQGKRPLSSMTPTIVVKDGKPLLILGARGGSLIISAVLQVVLNIIDYKMPIDLAVSEPRFHHQWQPDTLRFEKGAIGDEQAMDLVKRGHILDNYASSSGKIQAIFIDPITGTFIGAPDHREGGAASGY